MCHSIAGTPASATVGPDLTHLASRRSLAAGTLPMGKGQLYGWVADPQSIKPGSKMPTIPLEPNQLHAVVAYLETLK
jgi:cytochrome c oxidase subunit 2